MKELKLFINGEFAFSSIQSTFKNISPINGEHISNVHEASQSDVALAVNAAKSALTAEWGSMKLNDRLDLLASVSDAIMRRFDDFLEAEILDTGKPRSFAANVDIPRGAANFKIFSQLARNLSTECFHTDTDDGKGAINYSIRQPLGVIAVVCPWNLPLLLMTWKVAPALACGNTVVVKPSEETPTTATLLAEVMSSVGIPKGVYNVVHGFGPNSAGEFLTSNKNISAITFTGESRTGSAIMRAAADGVKHISFELGGKNPAIIFEDCNFDEAVNGTLRSVFANCGQVCLCSERVYVHKNIFEKFVLALKEKAEKLKFGSPFEIETTIGPLISQEHRSKVLSYFELAKEEGATFITGGGVPELPLEYANGCYVEPTIITGLSEQARCVKEEIFGPICHIQPFETDDEAISMANDSDYGLCAAVWTTNLQRAHNTAAKLDCGIVWINSWFLRDLRTPFGGTKLSGIGREGGLHSINFYSELKNVCVKL